MQPASSVGATAPDTCILSPVHDGKRALAQVLADTVEDWIWTDVARPNSAFVGSLSHHSIPKIFPRPVPLLRCHFLEPGDPNSATCSEQRTRSNSNEGGAFLTTRWSPEFFSWGTFFMITFCELFFTYGSGKGNEFPRTNEDIRHFSPPEKRNHSTRLSLKLRHHRVKRASKFFVQKVFRCIVQLQTKDCSSTSSRRGNIQVESPAPQPLLIEPAIRIGSALPSLEIDNFPGWPFRQMSIGTCGHLNDRELIFCYLANTPPFLFSPRFFLEISCSELFYWLDFLHVGVIVFALLTSAVRILNRSVFFFLHPHFPLTNSQPTSSTMILKMKRMGFAKRAFGFDSQSKKKCTTQLQGL